MALDGNSRWCYLDPKLGAMHAVAESARNVACTGATPIAATNCLNFGNPEKPHIMWQFSQTIDGITKACEELETPITGGNVSFYNETLGEGIYPTPVMGIVGILEDVQKAVAPHFRQSGRALIVLRGSEPGDAADVESRVRLVGVRQGDSGPALGLSAGAGAGEGSGAAEGHRRRSIDEGLVDSAKDCSEGGLAVTLAECGFASGIGARVDLSLRRASAGVRAVRRGRQPDRDFLRPEERGENPRSSGKIRPLSGSHRQNGPDNLEIRVDGKVAAAASVSELRS